MGVFDKAKEISEKIVDKAMRFSSDEFIADTIILAVKKQEKVNEILKEKGSKYRISQLDIEMGVPPKPIFGIRCINEK